MSAIFVSYRREDSAGHAGRLFDSLKERFGSGHVFLDVSGSIAPGEPFDEAIARAVGSCDVLLAVIGQRWLTSADAAGSPRIQDSGDYVRLEIGKALERGVRVIPVLVQGAAMPSSDDLPAELRPLVRHQAVELTDSRWDYDVSRLVDALEKLLRPDPWLTLPRLALGGAGVALIAALGIGGWMISSDRRAEPEPPPMRPESAELVAVPDLEALPIEVATDRLAEAGLRAGRSTLYTLGRYAPGTVYGQETAPGARVRPATAIGLYVERAPRPGIASSGRIFLSSAEVWDLDGTDTDREGVDIRFEASSSDRRLLQALNGAAIGAVDRRPLDREGCASASLSESPVQLNVGAYLCARTTEGRLSLLRIEDLGAELELSFDTWQTDPGSTSDDGGRQVRLSDGDSYHFLRGVRGQFQGGDFYLTIDDNGAAQFFANNRDQRGLVDLGDLGSAPLADVPVPEGGYDKFGVPVVSGHTYVSLARAGEEGHHIVFRVNQVTNDSVVLSYVYR